jgi:fructose-1,6-bisphosphatase/sedoheptulose 1,7-bisphosphatase-like protein
MSIGIKCFFKLGTTAVQTYTLIILAFERKHHAELIHVVSAVQHCVSCIEDIDVLGVVFQH